MLTLPTDNMTMIAWILTAIIYAVDFVVRLWLLIYIPRNRKPTAAMAWLLFIFIIPVFATLLFFVMGSTKLSRRRLREQHFINKRLKAYSAELKQKGIAANVAPPHDIQAKLAESLTGLAPTHGNSIRIISGYQEIIDEIILKINKAKSHVYVEFYILALDDTTEPFFEALEDAVKRRVKVRVLFDAWGSRKFPHYRKMMRRMSAINVEWHKILPVSFSMKRYNRIDLRNHRKIVVIDDTDAYTGSFNMIEKTYNRKDTISYIELVAHLQGPSVNQLAAVFASDWYLETDVFLDHFMKHPELKTKGKTAVQVIPSGSNYAYENNLKTFNSLIQSARKSVIITNPYLVPDESLLGALISAAQRGIKVSILNSEAMDQWMVGHAQRSYYDELLSAGVKIYLYRKPQLVHEKFIAIDEEVAVIGSSNLDIRSFELNLECVVMAYHPATARMLAKHHNDMLANSYQVKLSSWRKRSVWQSFLDSVARLSSAIQ